MTKLRPDTPLVRETDVFERTDALVVELYPKYMAIRLKGQKAAISGGQPARKVTIDYREVLGLARKLAYEKYWRDVKKGA